MIADILGFIVLVCFALGVASTYINLNMALVAHRRACESFIKTQEKFQ